MRGLETQETAKKRLEGFAPYTAMRAQRITKVELAAKVGGQRGRRAQADPQPGPPLPHESGAEGASSGGLQSQG